MLRLIGMFLAGSCFYLYRDMIIYRVVYAIVAVVLLSACLSFDTLAHFGAAVFGGYAVFTIAKLGSSGLIARVNNKDDISYGTYLYAWPVTKLVIMLVPVASVVIVDLITLVLSFMLGWISWVLVERPVLALVRSPRRFVMPAS